MFVEVLRFFLDGYWDDFGYGISEWWGIFWEGCWGWVYFGDWSFLLYEVDIGGYLVYVLKWGFVFWF